MYRPYWTCLSFCSMNVAQFSHMLAKNFLSNLGITMYKQKPRIVKDVG